MSRAIDSPRPVPLSSRLRALSQPVERLEHRLALVAGTPGPSSSTVTVRCPPSWMPVTRHLVAVAAGILHEVHDASLEALRPDLDHRVAVKRRGRVVARDPRLAARVHGAACRRRSARRPRRRRRGRRRDSPRASGSCRRRRASSPRRRHSRSISASCRRKRVRTVRRSWLTPASMAVRCSIWRSTRTLHVVEGDGRLRAPRAPRAAEKSGTGRPLPKSSTAAARLEDRTDLVPEEDDGDGEQDQAAADHP